ncbi:choline dehydrogenase-like flavoprotein [Litorivivens lipolytica]|uniref:Choline dehydrogenase-like flavoprotein n=1 Tax=Litorivivens lipolytica TaxID=1524264 RepID=A0A7W4W6F5_9GAMM|nr:GMC family oxidoreductase [Litorivivens lipolytica]MBB3047923.1 choline dehydrogenase-like flavoprotein [Litorivivens lipolytica]
MKAINQDFDAIVVGSGISGGWAAKELTEKGLKVLVLERGAELRHSVDYLGEHAPDWKLPYQGKKPRELYREEYPVQSTSYAFSEATRHFFNNDKQNPYVRDEGKPFNWIRANVVGGRSLLWGRQTYRWSEQDFQANAQDGHGIPWPVSYKDLAPWYSYVEKFIGVSGEPLGLDELPDSEFLPPMGMHKIEKTIKGRLKRKAPDLKLTMGRAAILTQDHKGRAACHYCGPCHRGCSTGSYFSSQSSTLPAAKATGKLTLRPDSVVEKLIYDPDTKRISEVRVIDSRTGERFSFRSRIVFLCASTVGSTQILMNSANEYFPEGLGNRSGALGRYMMDHALGMSALGFFVDDMDSYWYGNRPNGTYIPRFRNLKQQDESLDFVRGYGFQANVVRMNWQTGLNKKGFGADLKNSLRKPGMWVWALSAFTECLPDKRNRMTLHPTKKDRFGIPQVVFDATWRENEYKLWADAVQQADRIMKAAGAVFSIQQDSIEVPMGSGIHEMGTARMGADPQQAVVNANNQVHGIPNLFVTDGAAMTSSSCVNPSLTYMAFTARACDFAVKQLQAGKL